MTKFDLTLCLFCKKWQFKCEFDREFRNACIINKNEFYEPIEEEIK